MSITPFVRTIRPIHLKRSLWRCQKSVTCGFVQLLLVSFVLGGIGLGCQALSDPDEIAHISDAAGPVPETHKVDKAERAGRDVRTPDQLRAVLESHKLWLEKTVAGAMIGTLVSFSEDMGPGSAVTGDSMFRITSGVDDWVVKTSSTADVGAFCADLRSKTRALPAEFGRPANLSFMRLLHHQYDQEMLKQFRGVDLRCADMRHASLMKVDLEDAHLEGADLSRTNLVSVSKCL